MTVGVIAEVAYDKDLSFYIGSTVVPEAISINGGEFVPVVDFDLDSGMLTRYILLSEHTCTNISLVNTVRLYIGGVPYGIKVIPNADGTQQNYYSPDRRQLALV